MFINFVRSHFASEKIKTTKSRATKPRKKLINKRQKIWTEISLEMFFVSAGAARYCQFHWQTKTEQNMKMRIGVSVCDGNCESKILCFCLGEERKKKVVNFTATTIVSRRWLEVALRHYELQRWTRWRCFGSNNHRRESDKANYEQFSQLFWRKGSTRRTAKKSRVVFFPFSERSHRFSIEWVCVAVHSRM